MKNLNINYKQFSDLINLRNNVFYPLKNFPNREQLLDIIIKQKYKKKFFPFPIFLGVDRQTFLKLKGISKINLIYKKNKIVEIDKIKFFSIKRKIIRKYLIPNRFKKHQYFKDYDDVFRYMNFNISKIFKKNFRHRYFISPKKFIKKNKIKNLKYLAAFHTRNVPHKAHEWIHDFLVNKYNNLLIQPLVGQYRKGEFKDAVILNTNKMILKKYKNSDKKVFSIPFFSYPRYGGPKEAALHSLVRRNYGCTHFWVGRDHAGLKNYYKIYDSREYCKKNQKKLGLTIVYKNEPLLCKICKKISVQKCCDNRKTEKLSGTKIRKLLKRGKKIHENYMSKFISKNLSFKSLI